MTTAELVKQTLRGMQSLYQPIPSQLQSLYDFYWEHGGLQEQVASETAAVQKSPAACKPSPHVFSVGDLACLPSGGPVMTVCGVPDDVLSNVTACWFDTAGTMHEGYFTPEVLEVYEGNDEDDEDEEEEY